MTNALVQRVFLAALVGVLASCSSVKVSSSWKDAEAMAASTPEKIFLAVLTQNLEAKTRLESDLAAAAENRGLEVVKSGDLFSPNFTKENAGSKEKALKKIRDAGCDLILTATVLRVDEEERYVPVSGMTGPYNHYSWYEHYWNYYDHMYGSVYASGYYVTDKTYLLETNLFDAKSGKLLANVQSTSWNPPRLGKFSEDYTAVLLDELVTKRSSD